MTPTMFPTKPMTTTTTTVRGLARTLPRARLLPVLP